MDDMRFFVPFNNVSVISGRWADDNERLFAMEPRSRLRILRLQRGSNLGLLDQSVLPGLRAPGEDHVSVPCNV